MEDWFGLAEAWWLMLYFHLALRRTSYERLIEPGKSEHVRTSDPSNHENTAEHLRRLVGYSSQLHFLRITCLVRTLALRRMLGRRGIPAQIRIGVNTTASVLKAHAWLEVAGTMIGEPEEIEEKFKVLSSA